MRMLLQNFLLASGTGCDSQNYLWFAVIGVFAIGMFVLPMITNRKRGKQVNDMRTTLRVGDEIMTIGGIVGKVVEIREISATEKDFVIETGFGDHKSTMQFDLRALHENRTRMKELSEEAARQAELQRIAKEEKKSGKLGVVKKEEPTDSEDDSERK